MSPNIAAAPPSGATQQPKPTTFHFLTCQTSLDLELDCKYSAKYSFVLLNMRLLHTTSLELKLFMQNQAPDYVILSHRWSAEELTFEDIVQDPISNPDSKARKISGFSKVQGACNQAARDGYDWIWIDSCSIDKSSSAELQESINSMWNYYERSNICYVYMVDVPNQDAGWGDLFQQSEWFQRGWTLQELIAPASVEFFSNDWSPIGTKLERYKEIERITGVHWMILTHAVTVDRACAAMKLSWAAHRQVCREEDESYSLLGLFQLNLPMLYGEGRERAFFRLQEAIYNASGDQSLFLFRYSQHKANQPLLADGPTRFCEREQCKVCQSCITQCLPLDILYADITHRSVWETQAINPIMITATPTRNEISARFQLMDFQIVSDSVIFMSEDRLGDQPPPNSVSRVLILNITLNNHKDGALGILLYGDSNPELAISRRPKAFPVIVPAMENLTKHLKERAVLVCPRPSFYDRDQLVAVTFTLHSHEFRPQSWVARGCLRQITMPVSMNLNDEFRVETTKYSESHDIEVLCNLVIPWASGSSLALRLVQMKETWSIKEVLEMEFDKHQRLKDTLYSTSRFSDRCTAKFSNGYRLSIALRRLAASSRPLHESNMPQLRYQILVTYS